MPRKKTTKKITARSTTANRPKGKSAVTKQNKSELISILEQLNKEEINWLITQAETMVYNHKVEDVNEAARKLTASKKRSIPLNKETPGNETVDIVQAGGPKNYNILMGNARLFLNLTELKSIVKIAAAAEETGDGAGRLYRWFRQERNDILIDASIRNPKDPRLGLIHSILKERFTVG